MPKVSKVGKFRKTAAATAASLQGGSTTSGKKKTPSSSATGEVDWVRVPSKKSLQKASSLETENSENDTTATGKKNKKNQKDPSASADAPKQDSALSRGQRKRQAKREQYLKKEKMILSSLKLRKEDEQKKRIDGLDALKAALMETVQDKPSTPDDNDATTVEKAKPITSNKAKQKILASELTHMGLVMQHPAFQANPFEAIQEHLRNSLAKQGKQQEAATAVKIKEEKEAAQQRKQEKKERMSVFKKHKKTKRKFKATRSRSKK